MLSLNSAHKGATLFFAYSVGWSLLGIILVWHGFVIVNPFSLLQVSNNQFTLGVFEIIFGIIVAMAGNAVSFFRSRTDIMEENLERLKSGQTVLQISRE